MLYNSEAVFCMDYVGMVLCFGGVLGIALSKSAPNTYDPADRNTGLLISFTLSWVFAAVCVFNRRLRNVHFSMVLFYHGVFGLLCSILYIVVETTATSELRLLSFTGK